MKQLSEKQKIIYILVVAIILAGISIICTTGFKFDLMYSNNKRIDIYIGKDYTKSDIGKIAEEVFNKKAVIQTSQLTDDYASVTINSDITEEQIKSFSTKINEKYNIKEDLQNYTTTDIPNVEVTDVMKPYIFPISLSTLIIVVYFAIRYRKQNILKVIVKTIGAVIITEAVYFSLIALIRIPFGAYIMPISLLVYIITLMIMVWHFNKK